MSARAAHWIKANHQERMPPRMVAFDTESKVRHDGDVEIQEWRVGCAIRWRTDLKTSTMREGKVFTDPSSFWGWVSDYTRPGTRTVVWAHNLGHDVRISRMFEELPRLGFRLEWCNLDRNISSATWRSNHGTIVLADTWTWLPLPLNVIAPQVGMVKYEMPRNGAPEHDWTHYCMQDCEILYHVVVALMEFVSSEGLGNWQPTGAGMAYATWRHRFMEHKVLVHDDSAAIEAERSAMHTGRAEAWRHGTIRGEQWTEVDLRTAYLTIAASSDLPRKLHMHTNGISTGQYKKLRDRFIVLCRIEITTTLPCVPVRINGRHVWPVGTFETWLFDPEVDIAISTANKVRIREAWVYVRDPILRSWAQWVLANLRDTDSSVSNIARTHLKHCSRALIGRLSLRTPAWEYFGSNVDGSVGISHIIFPDEGSSHRLLHVGNDTLIETARVEGKDSLPMVTGYIMSKCRAMIWEAMNACGTENLAHVDTDSVLCNSRGLDGMRRHYGAAFGDLWQVKGTFKTLTVHGPRVYWRDNERKIAGVPLRAVETTPGRFTGEQWSALAGDLGEGLTGVVRVRPRTWELKTDDPRRADAPGGHGMTRPLDVAELGYMKIESSTAAAAGS